MWLSFGATFLVCWFWFKQMTFSSLHSKLLETNEKSQKDFDNKLKVFNWSMIIVPILVASTSVSAAPGFSSSLPPSPYWRCSQTTATLEQCTKARTTSRRLNGLSRMGSSRRWDDFDLWNLDRIPRYTLIYLDIPRYDIYLDMPHRYDIYSSDFLTLSEQIAGWLWSSEEQRAASSCHWSRAWVQAGKSQVICIKKFLKHHWFRF